MRIYEINYLILQSQSAELDKLRNSIKELVISHGANIVEEKEYLKRKLAYEIDHEGYGFFTVYRFQIEDSEKLGAMRKQLNLNPGLARYIIVKADELPSLAAIEEARATEKQKAAEKIIKVEDVEKIVSDTRQSQAEKLKKQAPPEKLDDKQVAASEKKPQEEQTGPKEKDEKTPDDKTSLDDLDKKLDEILNI